MSDKYNDFEGHDDKSHVVLCRHAGEGDFKVLHHGTSEDDCIAYIRAHRQGGTQNEYKIKTKGVA